MLQYNIPNIKVLLSLWSKISFSPCIWYIYRYQNYSNRKRKKKLNEIYEERYIYKFICNNKRSD